MAGPPIATGVWQNLSHSGWLASTLTLDVRTGTILISGLATFVTIVGGRFWVVLSFAIHQIRTRDTKKDGIHHQHQVVYRNQFSQLGATWVLIELAWAWRGHARRNILRMLLFILPPLFCFGAFAAASVLSAKVAAPSFAASEVRLQRRSCGILDWNTPDGNTTLESNKDYAHWITAKTYSARNYARSCYGESNIGLTNCLAYRVQRLPYTTYPSATCPFKPGRCLLDEQNAFQMQTPWLDSHKDLGINAKPHNRLQFRKVSTCSVLRIDDLTMTSEMNSETWKGYYLGGIGASNNLGNLTFTIQESALNSGFGYAIWPFQSVMFNPFAIFGWQPIPDLKRTDADISVFFLNQNGVIYPTPVNDPFFSAHRIAKTQAENHIDTYYSTDNLTSVLGCTDQFQFQDPNHNVTTQLTGSLSAYRQVYNIGLNKEQTAAATRLSLLSYDASLFRSVAGISTASLKAQDATYGLLSDGLPDNQWQIEAMGWFETSLATIQDRVNDYAYKDFERIPGTAKLVIPSESPELLAMCDQQIVRNVGSYQSFSMLGVGIIVAIGTVIILLSLCLETVVAFLQGRCCGRRQMYKRKRWQLDSILQQQRLAFQGLGLGDEWFKCEEEVPVTRLGEEFVWLVPDEHTTVKTATKAKDSRIRSGNALQSDS